MSQRSSNAASAGHRDTGDAPRISPVPASATFDAVGVPGVAAAAGIRPRHVSPPTVEDGGPTAARRPFLPPSIPLLGERPPGDDFPSALICPINKEPPAVPVTFDVPDKQGNTSNQVFEYSALYRTIANQGVLTAFRNVRHTINGAWVRRDEALPLISEVSPELKARIAAERARLSLSADDDEPVGPEEGKVYRRMVERIRNP